MNSIFFYTEEDETYYMIRPLRDVAQLYMIVTGEPKFILEDAPSNIVSMLFDVHARFVTKNEFAKLLLLTEGTHESR